MKPNWSTKSLDDLKTLRDEFAMAALTGIISSDPNPEDRVGVNSRLAYLYADVILSERNKTKDK